MLRLDQPGDFWPTKYKPQAFTTSSGTTQFTVRMEVPFRWWKPSTWFRRWRKLDANLITEWTYR